MLSIENEYLKISVQEKGAELCSIFSKQTQTEFMWDANPEIWGSYAPVLFPIIGCLKDNEFYHKGKTYSVPKHGFIRNNDALTYLVENPTTILFSYKFTEQTLQFYPFQFEFILRYQLYENSILVSHTIVNHHPSDRMYYSLGGHPGFKCPFFEGEHYEDYYIEFDHLETEPTWMVASNGLIESETLPFLNETNRIPLQTSIFANDALIFKNLKSKVARLKSDKHNTNIQLNFSDFDYLGIWAKPNANFVCIEPWLGISDSVTSSKIFEDKEGIQQLEGGESKQFLYTITLNE